MEFDGTPPWSRPGKPHPVAPEDAAFVILQVLPHSTRRMAWVVHRDIKFVKIMLVCGNLVKVTIRHPPPGHVEPYHGRV